MYLFAASVCAVSHEHHVNFIRIVDACYAIRGGAKVNDAKIEDELHTVKLSDFSSSESRELKLSSGKKKHVIVEIAQ